MKFSYFKLGVADSRVERGQRLVMWRQGKSSADLELPGDWHSGFGHQGETVGTMGDSVKAESC